MSLVLRCRTCRNSNLQIRSGIDIRWLTESQARSFGRHFPKPKKQAPQQLSLLEGGKS